MSSSNNTVTTKPTFFVYRASAGSGKTFNLVLRFLTISLDAALDSQLRDRFTHILAITFTKKATNEMKQRILRELQGIIDYRLGDNNNMVDKLCGNLHIAVDELKRRANVMFNAVLHDYGNLSISTIDSFMNRVVRTFAHDLHLPLGFTPNTDKNDLIQHAIDDVMNGFGTAPNVNIDQVLLAFANSQWDNDKRYADMERNIAELAEQLFQEDMPEKLKKLNQFSLSDFININTKQHGKNRELKEKIIGIASTIYAELDMVKDQLDGKGTRGPICYFNNVSNGQIKIQASESQLKIIAGDKPWGKETLPEEVIKHALQGYYNIQQLLKTYNTRELILGHLFEMALLNELNTRIGDYSRDNESIPIGEITRLIYNSVRNESAPFFFERIGSYYRHIMIDEFQDTSVMQWGALIPLINECMSYGCECLIVGDAKQAIYRFRQGKVQQFVDLSNLGDDQYQGPMPKQPDHGDQLWRKGVTKTIDLDTNYRTCKNIVTFNNTFFRWLVDTHYSANQYIHPLYRNLEQKENAPGGFVKAYLSEDSDVLNEQVYQTIHRIITNNNSPYTYNGITILARKNVPLTSLIAYLNQRTINGNPIPLQSTDSLYISTSRAVTLLVSLLRYLSDTTPTNAYSALAQLYNLGLIDDDPAGHYIQHIPSYTFEGFLHQQGYDFSLARLRSLPLIDLCEELIRIFSPENHLPECQRRRSTQLCNIDNAFVTTFLTEVYCYTQRHRQDLSEFLNWADINLSKIVVKGASSSAIKLMSIHKSKGLESPIVIFYNPFQKSKDNDIWVDVANTEMELPVSMVPSKGSEDNDFGAEMNQEQLQCDMDELNILYVALTRPKNALYIFNQYKEPKKEDAVSRQSLRAYIHSFFFEASSHFKGIDVTISENTDEQPPYSTVVIGTEDLTVGKASTSVPSTPVSTISYPSWHSRVLIANHSRQEVLALADKSDCSQLSTTAIGTLVHNVLATIDSSQSLQQLQQHPYYQGQPLSSQVVELVSAVVNHPQCSMFFNPQYRAICEAPIMSASGNEKRPDRIVLAPDATYVIDYKTGKPDDDEYSKQVKGYMELLCQMGYPNLQGRLVYIHSDATVNVVVV